MLPIVLAILCYISPNPAPIQWVVSGDREAVQALTEEVRKISSARVVATATDGKIAFARFALPAGSPHELLGELQLEAHQHGLLSTDPTPAASSCEYGGIAYVGSSDAPATVGLLGDAKTVRAAHARLPWVKDSFPFMLADGREGVAFRPAAKDVDAYETFVRGVARGQFAGVEVVLLKPAPDQR